MKDEPPKMDKHGHYPGCYVHGCAATRCADARLQIAFVNGLRKSR